MIKNFRGENHFLSNFCTAPILWDGVFYMNNEAAFQSAKLLSKEERRAFSMLDPTTAKRQGRKVQLRPDWEKVKYDIMYDIVKTKFEQNEALKIKLLATGDQYIHEENSWGDRVWGTVNGVGKNYLGKILMKVREESR